MHWNCFCSGAGGRPTRPGRRALWGVNLAYWLDGFVYFGMLGYMAMYFNQYVALSDIQTGWMLSFLTSGITVSMFFMGGLADRWGARTARLIALALMAGGRVVIAAAPFSGLSPTASARASSSSPWAACC